MYIPEKLALLIPRQQPPVHKSPAVLGVTTPIVGVFAAFLGYLCWRAKKRRRRPGRSRDSGPIVSANGFILGDVWDDGGGFDPDPRRGARGPSAPDTFIRSDVWDDGGGFDPDPRRSRNPGTEILLDDVWNDGESDGHVDVHPGRRDRRHSTRPRRRSTDDSHRHRHRNRPSRRRRSSSNYRRRNGRHRRRRSTDDYGGGHGGDRHERIQGDVWNDGEENGHVDRARGGREPSIAHSVTGNSHVFGTDDIDDRSFRTATVSVDEPSEMPTFPVRAHLPGAPANMGGRGVDDDLFSEDGSEMGEAAQNRLALALRRALHGGAPMQ
ncbi:uncharacterized protein PgNI_07015 [Pyricularia grisea]|uniref:Uncharacterized protein n=1 Tax=Pyricularia grisea TaxID=148305 RepID=A0A6P8B0Y7_PYRGI|nr:uncharacterized protein PgNI_07015 [Pyricularia grisea]TLD08491.1 hypothetical protein PgNI_07015 [Pyricularia grisea]